MATVIEEGYHPGGLDPNAPESNVAVRIIDNGDGTATRLEFDVDGNQVASTPTDPPEVERPVMSEAQRIAQVVVAPLVAAGDLDDVAAVADLFPPWTPYQTVVAGEVYQFDGGLVEVVQGHDTLPHWTPDVVPALFTVHRPAGAVTAWVQPVGAHDAYDTGDEVTHNGSTWRSDIDDNIWAPGVHGWTEL